MIKKKVINIASIRGLFIRFIRLFYGPTFYMTIKKTDSIFREKILLTVSMSNECGG